MICQPWATPSFPFEEEDEEIAIPQPDGWTVRRKVRRSVHTDTTRPSYERAWDMLMSSAVKCRSLSLSGWTDNVSSRGGDWEEEK